MERRRGGYGSPATPQGLHREGARAPSTPNNTKEHQHQHQKLRGDQQQQQHPPPTPTPPPPTTALLRIWFARNATGLAPRRNEGTQHPQKYQRTPASPSKTPTRPTTTAATTTTTTTNTNNNNNSTTLRDSLPPRAVWHLLTLAQDETHHSSFLRPIKRSRPTAVSSFCCCKKKTKEESTYRPDFHLFAPNNHSSNDEPLPTVETCLKQKKSPLSRKHHFPRRGLLSQNKNKQKKHAHTHNTKSNRIAHPTLAYCVRLIPPAGLASDSNPDPLPDPPGRVRVARGGG